MEDHEEWQAAKSESKPAKKVMSQALLCSQEKREEKKTHSNSNREQRR